MTQKRIVSANASVTRSVIATLSRGVFSIVIFVGPLQTAMSLMAGQPQQRETAPPSEDTPSKVLGPLTAFEYQPYQQRLDTRATELALTISGVDRFHQWIDVQTDTPVIAPQTVASETEQINKGPVEVAQSSTTKIQAQPTRTAVASIDQTAAARKLERQGIATIGVADDASDGLADRSMDLGIHQVSHATPTSLAPVIVESIAQPHETEDNAKVMIDGTNVREADEQVRSRTISVLPSVVQHAGPLVHHPLKVRPISEGMRVLRPQRSLHRVAPPSVLAAAPIEPRDSDSKPSQRVDPSTDRALTGATSKPLAPHRIALSNEVTSHPPAVSNPVRADNRPVPAATRFAAKWPFGNPNPADKSKGVELHVDNADVRSLFEMLARSYDMNILVAPNVEGTVTANMSGLDPEVALHGIVKMCGLNMQVDQDMIYIYPPDQIPADARQLRVFTLDFARASVLEPMVQGLLSPVGNAYVSALDDSDNMRTQESIVVVDIPSAIARVEQYIAQADQAPRQVMIEARVLEVQLSDDMMHGVNLDAIVSGDLSVGGSGLADPVTASNPMFFARIQGAQVNGLLDLLETTTDSKTLASPRVQVVNGQNARIQVGQQLGFTVATVTQTSTIQDVQFLETGVVLSVTPTISRDGRILMSVKPEVSDGEINPDTLLPEEETREVETSVLLDNHQGVVIGGLIQEKDRTVIRKLPWLGDVKHVGKLFQRREALRSRSEIIIALVPHIIEPEVIDERAMVERQRVETPLFQGRLQRTCRPWEPRMPDRAGADRHMDVEQFNRRLP